MVSIDLSACLKLFAYDLVLIKPIHHVGTFN